MVRCNMRNAGFAVHNTPEARDWVNRATRGLNHSVTGRRTLRNARTAQRPPERVKTRSGGLRVSPTEGGGPPTAYLSPLPLSSPPAPMDS
jgi:hypothetical protein